MLSLNGTLVQKLLWSNGSNEFLAVPLENAGEGWEVVEGDGKAVQEALAAAWVRWEVMRSASGARDAGGVGRVESRHSGGVLAAGGVVMSYSQLT